MNIYAFYDNLENFPCQDNQDSACRDHYKELIDIWQKSWKYYGWNPVIVTLNDAKKHKDYEKLFEICRKRPTVNRKDFETLCFLRWLSMHDKNGWYADVDMINYGFEPVDYGDLVVTANYAEVLHASCFSMPNKKYNQLIDEIVNYELEPDDFIMINNVKKQHISDMIVMSKTKIKIDKTLSVYSEYNKSIFSHRDLIVHYTSNCSIFNEKDKNKSRLQIIKEDPRSKKFL